jgi:hypothetical protein
MKVAATYDVLTIMDVIVEQGIDASVTAAVGEVIGHLVASGLDVLMSCGVPALKVVAVRRILMSFPASPPSGDTSQLNVLALLEAMDAMQFPVSLQELVARLFGLQDSVTLAELRAAVDAATLSGQDLLRLRRALDPLVSARLACAAQCQCGFTV